eukprot:1667822-Pyramimonas_sp.AAC.1
MPAAANGVTGEGIYRVSKPIARGERILRSLHEPSRATVSAHYARFRRCTPHLLRAEPKLHETPSRPPLDPL